MSNFCLILATTMLFGCFVCLTFADSNKNRTFIEIPNSIPCIRRFNATHQIGCGNLDRSNYDGIVYALKENIDFQRLKVLLSRNLINRNLILVTKPEMFTDLVEYYLATNKNSLINGIVLIALKDSVPNLTNYSDDTSRPNSYFSLYEQNSSIDWNSAGRSFMFQNFEIPFYVITEESEANLPFEECYDKFNKKVFERADNDMNKFKIYSTDHLCGMQLGIQYSGAVSTKVCARRSTILHTLDGNSFCDPLGGSSVISFLSQKPSNDLPVMVVSSRMDTFSMYEYYTPGANEPISSIIGLLSLAELMSKVRNDINTKNLLFVLFDNEAFDYGGSSRFSNDLALNKFPSINVYNETTNGTSPFKLDKSSINTILELGQLGSVGLNEKNILYIHKDPLIYNKNIKIQKIIDELIASLKLYSNGEISKVSNDNQTLPSSSVQSFLRQGLEVAGISIADHEIKYTNMFYHSVFDTPESLNIKFPDNITEQESYNFTTPLGKRLQKLVTNIAQTIYSVSSNKGNLTNDLQVDQITLNKLIYCFYKNTTCDFFKSILTDKQWQNYLQLLDMNLPKNKLSFYTGVNDNSISGKWISTMLLRYFTRNLELEKLNATECSSNSEAVTTYVQKNKVSLKSFSFVNNCTCVVASLYPISSVSPAFDKFNDGIIVNDNFPAWSESSWASVNVQMKLFMYTNDVLKIFSLVFGLVVFFISIGVTYSANRFSNKWFELNNPEQATEFFE